MPSFGDCYSEATPSLRALGGFLPNTCTDKYGLEPGEPVEDSENYLLKTTKTHKNEKTDHVPRYRSGIGYCADLLQVQS